MNETDRELLIWAAKAAGHTLQSNWSHSSEFVIDGDFWNPLTDYGDALMLADKLGLCLDLREDEAWVGQYPIEQGNNGVVDADVRRAIVLVAAEIGRNM